MRQTFSVITPSYNQGEFLRRTIESVECQTLKPIEHLVFDPGSTDDSREIASSATSVTLIAEPDNGQADAVARGMRMAKGDIIAWLNSDDEYYDEGVFARVEEAFASDEKPDIVYGDGIYVGKDDEFLKAAYVIKNPKELSWRLAKEVGILQPATFISKRLIERIGPVDQDFQFCMDYEFWIRAQMNGAKFMRLNGNLARARYYSDNKTFGQRGKSLTEVVTMTKRKYGFAHIDWVRRLADYNLWQNDGVLKDFRNTNKSVELLEAETLELNRLINGDYEAISKLGNPTNQRLVGETKAALLKDGVEHAHSFAKPIDLDAAKVDAHQCYTVGDQRWAFTNKFLENQFERTIEYFEGERFGRSVDTCVILGNGPSLTKVDLDQLKDHDVFITNYATINEKLLSLAKYLCVTNYLVAEQESEHFNLVNGPIKILPYWLSYCLLPNERTYYVKSIGHSAFGRNYRENISWRSTVSFFAMQIAYALGYRKVLLAGFDHSYTQPENVREGDAILQAADDQNHFDPRYFRGKTWQAADTGNMEAMYVLAKEAFEEDGREIVNCTVGGKLDLFRRGNLEEELGRIERVSQPLERDVATEPLPKISKQRISPKLPKVLVFDHTAKGDGTATGELKANIFAGWPPQSYLQVFSKGQKQFGLIGPFDDVRTFSLKEAKEDLSSILDQFDADVILYRPVPDTSALHKFAMQHILSNPNTPLITWVMDDWPARLEIDDPASYRNLNTDWLRLLDQSNVRLSICDQMSDVFQIRYGHTFRAIANGVDPSDWQTKKPELQNADERDFVIRYAGGLASNMNARSIRRIAEAVETLANQGARIRLEIQTKPIWKNQQESNFAALKSTEFSTTLLSAQEYREWLTGGDAVLIGYNFDEVSLRYIGLSMANKLPECLASGTPLIAHGPREAATIAYLMERDCALVIDSDDDVIVRDNISRLVDDAELRSSLADRGRKAAFAYHDIRSIRQGFQEMMSKVVAGTSSHNQRSDHARVDETAVIAELMKNRKGGEHCMIDVGAEFGGSAAHFDKWGWTIRCYEPDPANRAKLIERFKENDNVTIDAHAVSDEPQKGVPFFRSDESPGISGLHAFRDTHREEGMVDLTTVAEIIEDRGLSKIDFLKIDVEGFDFNVLKGVPWDLLRPDVIECEYEDSKTAKMGHTWRDIAEYLRERGYAVYISEWHPIIRYGIAHDWKRVVPYPGVDVSTESWGNMLAFREDPGYSTVAAAFEKLVRKHPDAPNQHSEGAKPGDEPAIPVAQQTIGADSKNMSRASAKWNKFRRNPKAFFADSNFPPLRPLRHLLPSTSRTKSEMEAKNQARRAAGGRLSFLPASRRALAIERAEIQAVARRSEARLQYELKILRKEAKNREDARQGQFSKLRESIQRKTQMIEDALKREIAVFDQRLADIDARLMSQYGEVTALGERVDDLAQSTSIDLEAIQHRLDEGFSGEVLEQIESFETELGAFLTAMQEREKAGSEIIAQYKAESEYEIESANRRLTAARNDLEDLQEKFESLFEEKTQQERLLTAVAEELQGVVQDEQSSGKKNAAKTSRS